MSLFANLSSAAPALAPALNTINENINLDNKPITYAVGAVLLASAGLLYRHQSTKDLAPGPRALPFLGNLLEVPMKDSWVYFNSLTEKYGPMIRLTLAGNEMLILNDLEDIEELLVKRSANYSSRQQLIYAGKYRSADRRLVLLPYGAMLKKQRAAVTQMMSPKVVGTYEHIQERGAMKLLFDTIKQPENTYINLKWYASETLLELIYGKKFSADGAELTTLLHMLESGTQDFHPLKHAVDTFPWLDYLPDVLAPWRKQALEIHNGEVKFYTRLLYDVKNRLDNGDQLECFAARLWEDYKKLGLDEKALAYVAGAPFEAGTDNTAGTVLWFLVAMMHYPKVQKKAQAELDSVLGADGLTPPKFQQLEQLTYCSALVKEVLRWKPVAPVSAPHYSEKDDVYKGYRIPAKTTVVSNIYALHHNEKLFPNHSEFYPERFVPANGGKIGVEGLNEGHFSFGFGRRVCPGQHLATKSVWIAMISLLWGFNITPPKDASGKPILPDVSACRSGITAEPATFKVVLTPRSDAHKNTIMSLNA